MGIAAAVEEQGAATQEIVRNVAEAASGTHAVTHTITAVAGSAEETGAAATQVLAASSRAVAALRAALGRGGALPRHRAGGVTGRPPIPDPLGLC